MTRYDGHQGQTGPYGGDMQQSQPRRIVNDHSGVVQMPYDQRRTAPQQPVYDEYGYGSQPYAPVGDGYAQSQPYPPTEDGYAQSQPYPPMEGGYGSQPYMPVGNGYGQSQPYPPAEGGYGSQPYMPVDGGYAQSQPYPPAEEGYGSQPYAPVQSPDGWPEAMREPQDPFDETGADPSLRDLRATSLVSRTGPFWDNLEQQEKKKRKRERQEAKAARKAARKASIKARIGSFSGPKALIALGIALVVTFLLGTALYRVRTINITGDLHAFTAADVREISGITYGQSMADIDPDDVAAAVNSNRYLIFRGIEVQPLSTVTINVKERLPAAVLMYNGTNYLIDHRGMVLEEKPTEAMMAGLPVVSGIQVKGNYGCMVGSYLKIQSSTQFGILCELLLELRVQSAHNLPTTINLSNPEYIQMEVNGGYDVILGDGDNLHGKIKALIYVIDALGDRGGAKGTIDVSNRLKPTFIPD